MSGVVCCCMQISLEMSTHIIVTNIWTGTYSCPSPKTIFCDRVRRAVRSLGCVTHSVHKAEHTPHDIICVPRKWPRVSPLHYVNALRARRVCARRGMHKGNNIVRAQCWNTKRSRAVRAARLHTHTQSLDTTSLTHIFSLILRKKNSTIYLINAPYAILCSYHVLCGCALSRKSMKLKHYLWCVCVCVLLWWSVNVIINGQARVCGVHEHDDGGNFNYTHTVNAESKTSLDAFGTMDYYRICTIDAEMNVLRVWLNLYQHALIL